MGREISRRTRRWLLVAAVVFWSVFYLLTLVPAPRETVPPERRHVQPVPAPHGPFETLA